MSPGAGARDREDARRHPARAGWRLGGGKLFVPGVPGAELLLVAGRTQPGTGARGVTLFLVEATAPGVRVRPLETIDLTRRIGEVELRAATVARDAVVGKAGAGW